MMRRGLSEIRMVSRGGGNCLGKAFTLVELLVVVSVIALLMSILMPSLRKAREQGKSAKCLTNIKGIVSASHVFAASHNGLCQLVANDGNSVVGLTSVDAARNIYEYDENGELLCWPVALMKESSQSIRSNSDWGVLANSFDGARKLLNGTQEDPGAELFRCPSNKSKVNTPMYPEGTSLRGESPVATGMRYWGMLSYGINQDLMGVEENVKSGLPWPAAWQKGVMGESNLSNSSEAGRRLRGRIDRVFTPESCLVTADAGPENVRDALQGVWDLSLMHGFGNVFASAGVRNGPYLENFDYQFGKRVPRLRHSPEGAINVGFADGHASKVTVGTWENHHIVDRVPKRYNVSVRISPYKP